MLIAPVESNISMPPPQVESSRPLPGCGITRTVSIDIYDRVQALDYSGAQAMSLVLLAISFAVLCVVYGLNRQVWRPWLAK